MAAKSQCWMKDLLAVLLAFAGLGVAVWMMIEGELASHVPLGAQLTGQTKQAVISGLMLYFKGIGGAILLSSIAYIMVGQDDTVQTTLSDSSKR
jgi:hypothetical protein